MNLIFSICIRFFVAFLAAKLLLGWLGWGSPEALLGLAAGLAGLSYVVKVLEAYYQRTWQSKTAELGWRVARWLIGLNQVKDRQPRP